MSRRIFVDSQTVNAEGARRYASYYERIGGYQALIESYTNSVVVGRPSGIPTETVYGLGVGAENEPAVARMYEVKGRPVNYLVIVHMSDQNLVSYWTEEIPEYANALMRKFWPGPLTLILKRSGNAKDFVTGGQEFVKIFKSGQYFLIKLNP